MSYFIGGNIDPEQRFMRLLQGPAEEDRQAAGALDSRFLYRERERDLTVKETAYFLWENAGRPAERQQEFWVAAERELGRSIVTEYALNTAHMRAV